MSFWKHIQSNVQTLLDKKDVTLREILAENDILQELRAHSAKLLKFILQPTILEELVDLIIHDPDPQMDYKYQYKLPNMACEVLTFDIQELNDALMGSPYLLTKVCNVFRQEDALNDLTASFVCKLLIVLATKRTAEFLHFIQYYDPERCIPPAPPSKDESKGEEDMIIDQQPNDQTASSMESEENSTVNEMQITDQASEKESVEVRPTDQVIESNGSTEVEILPKAEKNSSFIDILLNHINNSAIKDLINKMVACSDNPELRPKVVEWLAEAQLVSKLVAMLSSDNSEQVVTNSAKCICKIIKVGREQQIFLQEKCPPDPLLESIEDTKMIIEILDNAVPDSQDGAWTLYESNFILLSLLQYKKTVPSFQDMVMDPCFLNMYGTTTESSPIMGELDNERAIEAIGKCLAALTDRLPALLKNLDHEQDSKFGSIRLEIVKLIAAMVSCANDLTLEALRDSHVLPIMMNLFFAYPLCSQLHNQVDTIVQAICTPPKMDKVKTTTTSIQNEEDEDENDGDKEMTSEAPPKTDENAAKSEEKIPPPKHILMDQLITECALLERILDNYKTIPKEQKGYNGHLRLMANYVEGMAENGFASYYNEYVNGLSSEIKERWDSFKENLTNINRHYAKTIDPMNTTAPCSEGEDPEDLRDMGIASADAMATAQQAFIDYQMNQVCVRVSEK